MKWIGSPNHGDRNGHAILGVVIHVTEGSMASADSWFQNMIPGRRVSAHYGISRTGEVHQYVNDDRAAWHAGRILNPTASLVLARPNISPNLYTLGIEHEGTGAQDFTEVQYETSARLIAKLAKCHGFKISHITIIPHRAIFAGKSCPGPVDMVRLIARAETALMLLDVPPVVPAVVKPPRPAPVAPPMNLEAIQVPRVEHVAEIARVRRLAPEAVRAGLSVAEVLARAVAAGHGGPGKTVARALADALADYIKQER